MKKAKTKKTNTLAYPKEYENPWEDKKSAKHKNIKAVKPEKKKESPLKKEKLQNFAVDERWEYVEKLLDGSLKSFPKKVQRYADMQFGKKWTGDFMNEVLDLKDDLLSSCFLPDARTMILLRFIFILQEGC